MKLPLSGGLLPLAWDNRECKQLGGTQGGGGVDKRSREEEGTAITTGAESLSAAYRVLGMWGRAATVQLAHPITMPHPAPSEALVPLELLLHRRNVLHPHPRVGTGPVCTEQQVMLWGSPPQIPGSSCWLSAVPDITT